MYEYTQFLTSFISMDERDHFYEDMINVQTCQQRVQGCHEDTWTSLHPEEYT